MPNRPRILILDVNVATDGNLTPTYLGRWKDHLDYDAISSGDQVRQWRTLPTIAHNLLICTPLPWYWAAPPIAHLIVEIKAKYEGPIIIVSNYLPWSQPLKALGCHIAKGPAMVPSLIGQLLFGEPRPTS